MPVFAHTAMADAHETLLMFAEVAVAIAGFSGIIIAFGRRSLGSLTRLELRRLSNLFALSGFLLLSSLLGVTLLHMEATDVRYVWRSLSGVAVIFGTLWLVVDCRKVTKLDEAERSQVKAWIFYPFTLIAVFGVALQAANVLVIAKSWPFFLGLFFVVAFAFQQFILLVRMGFRDV
jgi:hypothetical protein